MRRRYVWVLGLVVTLALILIPIAIFFPENGTTPRRPGGGIARAQAVDGPPAALDRAVCLRRGSDAGLPRVHAEEAGEVMQTVHWTWESKPYQIPGHDDPVTIGKKNSLNNFCIGIQSNWAGCTSCHAGYGWEDAEFDFTDSEKIDCLVCHDNTGTYLKGDAGQPAEGVDLAYVAQSVTLADARELWLLPLRRRRRQRRQAR